jgi:hypothetical protein
MNLNAEQIKEARLWSLEHGEKRLESLQQAVATHEKLVEAGLRDSLEDVYYRGTKAAIAEYQNRSTSH